jgi:hypothetical protein
MSTHRSWSTSAVGKEVFTALAEGMPASELWTLLLEVVTRRAARRTPKELRAAITDPVTKPSAPADTAVAVALDVTDRTQIDEAVARLKAMLHEWDDESGSLHLSFDAMAAASSFVASSRNTEVSPSSATETGSRSRSQSSSVRKTRRPWPGG